MTTNLLEQTLDELARRRGQWPAICRATGLDYDWLTKLAQGRIADPGVRKIQRLSDFFEGGACSLWPRGRRLWNNCNNCASSD